MLLNWSSIDMCSRQKPRIIECLFSNSCLKRVGETTTRQESSKKLTISREWQLWGSSNILSTWFREWSRRDFLAWISWTNKGRLSRRKNSQIKRTICFFFVSESLSLGVTPLTLTRLLSWRVSTTSWTWDAFCVTQSLLVCSFTTRK